MPFGRRPGDDTKMGLAFGSGDDMDLQHPEEFAQTTSMLDAFHSESIATGPAEDSATEASKQDVKASEESGDAAVVDPPAPLPLLRAEELTPGFGQYSPSLGNTSRSLDVGSTAEVGLNITTNVQEAAGVHVQMQGDLDMYSHENQLKRLALKGSERMKTLAAQLWILVIDKLVDCPLEEEKMNKTQFGTMLKKLHRLMVPIGGVNDVEQMIEEEWEHDSAGKDAIDFEMFYDSMWQLVDHWTETVEEEEYVAMFKRLVQGTTSKRDDSGRIEWREDKDIKYDSFFAFMEERSAEAREDEEQAHAHGLDDEDIDQVMAEEGQDASEGGLTNATKKAIQSQGMLFSEEQSDEWRNEQRRASGLHKHTADEEALIKAAELKGLGNSGKIKVADKKPEKKQKKKKKKTESTPMILAVKKTLGIINAIYKAKIISDETRSRPESNIPEKQQVIKMDKFVIKWFQVTCGSRGAARRHLRSFVASVQYHAKEEAHPRICLFCVVSGIGGKHYDSRMMPHHVGQLLRHFFPDPAKVESSLGTAEDAKMMVSLEEFVMHSTPHYLHKVALAEGIIKNHVQRLEHLSIVPKGCAKKKREINLDEAMLITLPIWEISLEMHLFRRSWAIKKMYKGIKRFLKMKREEKIQRLKSMRDLKQKQIDSYATNGVHQPAVAGGATSSPRAKIATAQDLDKSLNGNSSTPG